MARDWDYAKLSKAASEAGGPEKLLDLIEEKGKSIGRMEGGLAALGASALFVGVFKLIEHFKTKRAISQAAVDAAKAELIQGIKEYDATHPDESEADESEEGGESNE